MELSELKYIKLSPDFEIPPFHCEDDDLNAFLIEDAKDAMDEMMLAMKELQERVRMCGR